MPRRSIWFARWFVVGAVAALLVLFSGGPAAAADTQPFLSNLERLKNVLTGETAAPPMPVADSVLTLLPRVENAPFDGELIEAIDLPGQTFLPLAAFVRILGFAITVDSGKDIASGFFFAPENTFNLDLNNRTVRIRSTQHALTRGDVRKRNGQIYVDVAALTAWFGVGSAIDRAQSTILFSTDRKRPQEAWDERAALWAKRYVALEVERQQAQVLPKCRPAAAQRPSGGGEPVAMRRFSGEATPGYQVELYRDDALAAFQIADAQGRYDFADIVLSEGEHVVRTVAYGAQGQRSEKTETVAVTVPPCEMPPAATATPVADHPADVLPRKEASAPIAAGKSVAATAAKNWTERSIVRDHQTLGAVEAFVDLKGTFLRLDSLLRLLGISYRTPDSVYALDIVRKDGSVVALDIPKRVYVENGQQHGLYDNDAFGNEDKIFVNMTLLNRILPPNQFVEDPTTRSVDVTEAQGGILGLWSDTTTDTADMAPPPLAAPVQPVIVDDVSSGQQQASGAAASTTEAPAEAGDVLHLEQPAAPLPPSPAPPSAVVAAPPKVESVTTRVADKGAEETDDKTDGNDVLILQPRIKSQPPSNVFIEALDLPGGVFLPLNDLVQILEFPIKVDPERSTASGFFLAPENIFELDVEKRAARVGSERYSVTRSDVRRREGQIYVSVESFAKWFGIASAIDRTQSTIHFTTDKKLPEEEREERQKRWQKMLAVVEPDGNHDPVLQNDYQAIGYPTVDVNLGSSYTHTAQASSSGGEGSQPFAANYNIQGAMDLAYLTGQFYAQGSMDGSMMDTLRFQAGRKDPGGGLLGGLHATEFSLGDVTSPSLTLVTSNSLGRGFTVSNRDLSASENFDFRNFSGDSVPGYEVELYRNNVLVAFQTVDASGRYNFVNIPILYGENTFRIVFYGSQGQREERVESVSASSALLKENKFVYTLAADERGKNLLPVGRESAANPSTPAGMQLVGGVRYGLTRDVTVGAALASTNLSDGEHRYVSVTTGANIQGVLTETTVAKDLTDGGWAGSVSALGGFYGISLRARYRHFSDFLSESVNNFDLPLASDAALDANTQLYVPILGDYSVGFSALRESFADTSLVPRNTYSWRSSKSLWGLSFTSSAEYIVDAEKRFQDTFGVQTRLWGVDLRAVGTYEIKPVRRFRDANFMADYRLTERLSAQTQIEKDLTSSDRTSFGQSINWDFDTFRLSFYGQMDNSSQYSVGMNVLFSLNHDKATDSWRMQPQQTSGGGAITGRVFVDEDGDGKPDEGGKLMPDVKVRVNRAAATLSPDGYFVAPVTPYEPSRVELDEGSITDPLLTPVTRGYQVVTRPGDTVVADFPLVRTTIIDGTVTFLDDKGDKRELGDIVVELEDKDGKPLRRVMSAVDGYFIFDKIKIGEYLLTVPEEALAAYNAALDSKVRIVIEEVSEFVTGKDILLLQKEKLNGPPIFDPIAPAAASGETAPPLPSIPSLPPPEAMKPESYEVKPRSSVSSDPLPPGTAEE